MAEMNIYYSVDEIYQLSQNSVHLIQPVVQIFPYNNRGILQQMALCLTIQKT